MLRNPLQETREIKRIIKKNCVISFDAGEKSLPEKLTIFGRKATERHCRQIGEPGSVSIGAIERLV